MGGKVGDGNGAAGSSLTSWVEPHFLHSAATKPPQGGSGHGEPGQQAQTPRAGSRRQAAASPRVVSGATGLLGAWGCSSQVPPTARLETTEPRSLSALQTEVRRQLDPAPAHHPHRACLSCAWPTTVPSPPPSPCPRSCSLLTCCPPCSRWGGGWSPEIKGGHLGYIPSADGVPTAHSGVIRWYFSILQTQEEASVTTSVVRKL